MKLLLDQNLSRRIPPLIEDLFPGSDHIGKRDLDLAADQEVWNFARDHGFAILSKDSDFHQMSLLRGFPPKVILSLLRGHVNDIRKFLDDTVASLLIMEG
jgi:hypothetical protein